MSARHRALAWDVSDATYVADTTGAFIDVNPAFLSLVGARSVDDLRHHPFERMWIDLDARHARVATAVRDGACTEECDIQRFDGEVRVVIDRCARVTDSHDGSSMLVGTLVDITALRMRENELRHLAVRDPLTGCYNRHYLGELTPVLEFEETMWGVIILDLDRFKRYNDEHGHKAGDEILTRTARFLMQQLRAEDVVIRIGGDEFVALLVGDDTAHVEEVARRLERSGKGGAPAPFSLGWSTRKGNEALSATIERADQELIHVKTKERPVYSRRTVPRRSGPVNRAVVLIVDDDVAVRSAVKRYIERDGHLVVEASNGAEALAALDAHDVTLAFVSIGAGTGTTLLDELRARQPLLTLVAMSPIDEVLARTQERCGPLYLLSKPFPIDRFLTILRIALR